MCDVSVRGDVGDVAVDSGVGVFGVVVVMLMLALCCCW